MTGTALTFPTPVSLGSLDHYIQAVNRFPLLTAEQETALGRRWKAHEDVDAAFDKALAFGAKGLVNAVDTFINSRRFALAAGAAEHKLPFVYSDVEYVMAGGLMFQIAHEPHAQRLYGLIWSATWVLGWGIVGAIGLVTPELFGILTSSAYVAAQSRARRDENDQRPFHSGLRFSMKAETPSLKSSDM